MLPWNKPAIAERAKIVGKILRKAFPSPAIPLDHTDTWTFLVAVVLSAQCTDKRVNLVTPILFKRAKTPLEFSKMTEAELRAIIRPCGLSPMKSKNLIATAKIILAKHQGQVPSTREELEELPGVGRKTASVILSQVFGEPAFPVDTHILRSAVRWGLSRGKTPEAVERNLCALYPKKEWNPLHLRIIYYARAFCKAHTCKTNETLCPLCKALGRFE